MKRITVPHWLPSLATSITLCASGVWILQHGPQSAPRPLRDLFMSMNGLTEEPAAKAIVAILFAFALLCLFLRDRRIALLGGGLVAFGALASISRAFKEGDVSGAMALAFALGVSCIALALLSKSKEVQPQARRGLSSSWRVFAALLAFAVGPMIAARLDFQQEDHTVPPARIIDLQLETSIGRTLDSTAVATYLPTLSAMIAAGGNSGWIVFFNPHCSACHVFFAEHFQGPQLEPIIAVEIPLADGETAAAGDEFGRIECATCEFIELPRGPLWLVPPPAVLRIENGIVTCYSDKISGDCFGAK
ncbi:MAG: hypothetical protein EXS10_02105 [Phycisphaerales bacterium]|nr:hypothetical protein [Phycisphaerales bacterium]